MSDQHIRNQRANDFNNDGIGESSQSHLAALQAEIPFLNASSERLEQSRSPGAIVKQAGEKVRGAFHPNDEQRDNIANTLLRRYSQIDTPNGQANQRDNRLTRDEVTRFAATHASQLSRQERTDLARAIQQWDEIRAGHSYVTRREINNYKDDDDNVIEKGVHGLGGLIKKGIGKLPVKRD